MYVVITQVRRGSIIILQSLRRSSPEKEKEDIESAARWMEFYVEREGLNQDGDCIICAVTCDLAQFPEYRDAVSPDLITPAELWRMYTLVDPKIVRE